MAGRSRRYEISVELENRARDLRALGSAHAGSTEADYVSQWLQGGQTLTDLASDLSEASGVALTAADVENWVLHFAAPKRRA